MKRAVVSVLVIACAAGCVVAAGAVGAGAFVADRFVSLMPLGPMFPECADADERLASSLGTLGILDARPDGAEPYGKREGGCDDDDRLAYAGQSYRLPGSRAGVLSFYRKAALRDGWKSAPVSEREEGLEQICLAKVVDGRNAYLSVWYPRKAEEGGAYHLQVRSGPSGGNLC